MRARWFSRFAFFIALPCFFGCSPERGAPATPFVEAGPTPEPEPEGGTPSQPAGFKDGISLVEAVDKNPSPDIVEVDLEAKMAPVELLPGSKIEVLTYNGALPGPLIRAKVGDRVIIHFKNGLSSPTTIHWHGVRVPANMDGTPASQDPVMPGDTFDYDFRVPDAALYWYHPHVESATQVGEGLYGALMVDDPSEPRAFGDEVVMVLSDIDFTDGGEVTPPSTDPLVRLFGGEGNVILVNGRVKPRLVARAGLRQRWRVVNAGRSRFFQLSLAGHKFTRIGGDGGLIEAPVESDMVVVAPGERADLSMVPTGRPGSDIPLRWVPYDRGYGTAFARVPEDIMTVHLDSAEPVTPATLPTSLRTIAPLDMSSATTTNIALTISALDAGPDAAGLQINGQRFETMVMAKVGETSIWTIDNKTDWDHPWHQHGFFFQPLDESGQPVHEWKDTFDVPANKSRRFVVHYEDRPGDWMFHCHILDHAEIGMMGMLMLR
jgi:FtsP/CotA-like multicopper oxidase with cupredoxin domain